MDTVYIGTCVICQTTYPRARNDRPRVTCYSPLCLRAYISQRRHDAYVARRQRVTDDPWTRPIPPPPPPPHPPSPTRARVLPDGTIALVIWAGDMIMPTGEKGGILEERRSHPYRLADRAPDFSLEETPRLRRRRTPGQQRRAEQDKQQRATARQRRAELVAALLRGETV